MSWDCMLNGSNSTSDFGGSKGWWLQTKHSSPNMSTLWALYEPPSPGAVTLRTSYSNNSPSLSNNPINGFKTEFAPWFDHRLASQYLNGPSQTCIFQKYKVCYVFSCMIINAFILSYSFACIHFKTTAYSADYDLMELIQSNVGIGVILWCKSQELQTSLLIGSQYRDYPRPDSGGDREWSQGRRAPGPGGDNWLHIFLY